MAGRASRTHAGSGFRAQARSYFVVKAAGVALFIGWLVAWSLTWFWLVTELFEQFEGDLWFGFSGVV